MEPYRPEAPDFERLADGSVVVRSVKLARDVLRSGDQTVQSGFSVESLNASPAALRPPVLFQDGDEHRQQRTAIAAFFTPKAVNERYRATMERYTDEVLADLVERGTGDLSDMAMTLSVRVAAEVVGLTDSADRHMDRRLDAFFALDMKPFSWRPDRLLSFLKVQARVLWFYLRDVRPAIQARRRERRDDVISQLIDKGYRDADILIEAVTFGAAGMVTTREFIAMAAWHLLADDDLRERYLASEAPQRQRLLNEVLRLEPVVGHLYRRTVEPLELDVNGTTERLEPGTRIDIDILSANVEEAVVGEQPMCLRPDRTITGKGIQPYVMSFGDGHHRCPGSYLALEESDVFLNKLLRLPGIRVVKEPELGFGELVKGYELRNFQVAVG